jgi:hypothetical protein
MIKLVDRTVTTVDPVTGSKERQLTLGTIEDSVLAMNASEHQSHGLAIGMDPTIGNDLTVAIKEQHHTGGYKVERKLSLTTLIHLLANIHADEIAEIIKRDEDHAGHSTKY